MNDPSKIPSTLGRGGEEQALRRAQQHAREIAARTGTPLVIYRDGKVEKHVVEEAGTSVSEQTGPSTKAD